YAAGLDFSDDLVNLSDEVQAITYNFKPRIRDPRGDNPAEFCDQGGDMSITIYLNPTPKLSVSVPEVIWCDSSTVNITVDDNTLNVFSENTKVYQLTTTYTNGAVEGVQPSGEYVSDLDITDDLVNLSQEVQQIDYHFKARIRDDRPGHNTFCDQGGDTTITIWLNPTPGMSVSVADSVWCDSSTVNITVDDDLSGVLGSKVYQLTTIYDPLGVEGVQATGEYAAGLDFSDDLVNLSDEVQMITYRFKSKIKDPRGINPAEYCDQGSDMTIRIYLNPTPELSVSVPEEVYCDSSTVNIIVNDDIGNVFSENTKVYQLTTTYTVGAVEGVQANGEYVAGLDISDNLVNKTLDYQTIEYHFKARIRDDRPGHESSFCDQGGDTTIVIILEPSPRIMVDIENDTICNEDFITLNVNNPTNPFGNWRYKLEVDYGDSIVGTLPEVPLFLDYDETVLSISDTLENIGLEWGTVTYTFMPYIQSTSGGDSCMNWRDTTITVWVNPTPAIRVTTEDTVICNGETTVLNIHNPNKFVYGDWIYDLIVTPDFAISGNRLSDTALIEESISETLFNDDTIVHKVEYRFIPRKTIEDSLICSQVHDTTIVIWVNPTPEIRLTADDLEICDGDTISLEIRNPNVDVLGVWYYDLEISKTSEDKLLGVSSGSEPYNINDTTYNYILTNTDTIAHQVTYTYTPRIRPVDGGNDCWGGLDHDTSITITVLPTPEIRVQIPDTILCDGQFANFAVNKPNNNIFFADWWYELVVEDPSGFIEGENQDSVFMGPNFNFDDHLFNTDTVRHQVIYHFIPRITPSDGSSPCNNGRDTTITVWINPTPRLFVNVDDSIFCNNEYVTFSSIDGLGEVFGDKEYIVRVDYLPSWVTVIGRPSGNPGQDTLIAGSAFSDSLVNHTNSVQTVFYSFIPRIFDNRPGQTGAFCPGDTVINFTIKVNPTPLLAVNLDDTIVCDSAIFEIEMDDLLGSVEGVPVYDLQVTYNSAVVVALISEADGEVPAGRHITSWIKNNSDTVQVIEYNFIARIRDDRPGQDDCRRGTDTTIYVYLNPTPRLDYQYLLGQDTLCYLEGFELSTLPQVYATSDIYYWLGVVNDDGMGGVAVPPDSSDASLRLIQSPINNPLLEVGTIEYSFTPFISNEGCLGKDTAILVRVNPLPIMEATQSDTAVCFNWGYSLPMNHPIISTTGAMQYQVSTDGYNSFNIQGAIPPDDYYFIDTLDQFDIRNIGDSIEDVTYHMRPFIRDARQDLGAGAHCWGDPLDSIVVEVAPEFKGSPWADTADFGGWEIRCNGLLSETLHSNVWGGYYRDDYTFSWDTTSAGGTYESLNEEDSTQFGLGVGEYWFRVVDKIGCDFISLPLIIEQPDTIEVDTTITDAACASPDKLDGAIDIEVTGGTTVYSYFWNGPFSFTSTDEDIVDNIAGNYHVRIRDANLCQYDADYEIGSAREIIITPDLHEYYGYGVMCSGDSNGFIDLSVAGGFPGYSILVYDHDANDTIDAGTIPLEGGDLTLGNLDAGTYTLFAIDAQNCYNLRQPEIIITEPDPLEVWKDNQRYSDTVDISCYGEDDGEIHPDMTGGRTHMYPNTFVWTGPPGAGIIQGDSIQSGLEPGLYTVTVTDIQGCEGDSSFTLIEPSPITLKADTIYDYNSWNISCFGRNDGFIDISSQGGIMGHEYDWYSDAMPLSDTTLQDQSGLVVGRYEVHITDSIGCTLDTFFTLTEPNPVEIDSIIPKFSDFAIACADSSTGQITVIPNGGADSTRNTYDWSTSNGSGLVPGDSLQTGLTDGIYTVVVTDINGCDSTWAFTLTQPEPIVFDEFSPDSAKCADTPTGEILLDVSGGVPGYTYLWSSEYGNYYTEDLAGIYAGFYTVVVTDTNSCVKTDTITVYEADEFDVAMYVTSDFNGTPVSCADSSDAALYIDTIGGLGPYRFAWNNGATTQHLVDVPAGTYKVIVNDVYGCIDSAEVVITQPGPILIDVTPEDPLCFGDSTGQINMLVTGGTVYSLDDYEVWLNGLVTGSPFVENLPAGQYAIRIEDLNDCYTDVETVLIDNELLELSFYPVEPAYCPDKADGELGLVIDGGVYPYHVSWNNGLPDNEQYFNDVSWGEYIATVSDANLCITSDTVYVDYTYETCLVIPNAFSPNGDGFNDLWIIENIEFYKEVDLKVFDRWGSMVYITGNAADEPWDGTFNGRTLPIDSYHYILDLNYGDNEPRTGNVTIVR
ncbi:MAG: T9SS type B sorting domain-containing protein, partial [Bacteroidetes bacterium]|nr:T9SS type B sorting domain-containing protein [Bacteroidota bacterium]